jgi:hypothetical protein
MKNRRAAHFVVGVIVGAFCQCGWSEESALAARARVWAEKLLGTENLVIQPYDTYWNTDGTPHAELFQCRPGDSSPNPGLTLALGPQSQSLLFYYFAEPFDRQFRTNQNGLQESDSRVVVTPAGLWLETSSGVGRIPHPPAPGKEFFSGAGPAPRPRPRPGDGEELLEPALSATKGLTAADAPPLAEDPAPEERIIPGVPNYLWYLNCALTSESMVLGYWNDHGCPGLVPGLNSTQGWYYAITEELMWLRDDRLRRYGAAAELGYGWQFDQVALPNTQWSNYVSAIQTAPGPLLITWSGPPYGAHSTVGVGYRIETTNRFLVLHDTWVATRAYVNYDIYATSIVTMSLVSLNPASSNPPPATHPIPVLSYGVEITPTSLVLSPALSYSSYSYHTLERGDYNGDGLADLLIGNFRNNVSSNVRLMLYTNSSAGYVRDSTFAPPLEWYECVHVARACDFDRDGDVDVAVSGYWMPVRIYLNTGKTLNHQSLVLGNEYSTYGHNDLAWGDLDGDGDSDLAACIANPYQTEGKIKIYLWQDGAFQLAASRGLSSHWYTAVQLRDLNKDSRPELLCANRRGSVLAFLNTAGQFAASPFFMPETGHGALAFDVADLDADGFVEIVTVDDGRIVSFDNSDAGLSPEPRYLDTGFRLYAKDLQLADLNHDGYPELLVANYNTPSAIFLNRRGSLEPRPVWLSPGSEPGVRIHIYEPESPAGLTMIGWTKARGCPAAFNHVWNRPVFAGLSCQSGKPLLSLENLVPGWTYAIERTCQFQTNGWLEVLRFQSASNDTNWTDASETPCSQGFYRARCNP